MRLAEHIIALLFEDRIDDLIQRYPELKFNRPKLTKWLEFDPTYRPAQQPAQPDQPDEQPAQPGQPAQQPARPAVRQAQQGKYFQWIIRQVAAKKLKLPSGGERVRDDLMRFERLLALPSFTGDRDIFKYDNKTLGKMIRQTASLQSKSEQERENRFKGVKVVGSANGITAVEIKNSQELMKRARLAYSKTNPNWTGAKKELEDYDRNERFGDRLWCVRFREYATSYLADGPFYMVYKNNGPYVGIVFHRGECQSLENQPISMGVAEEIYPALRDIIDIESKSDTGLTGNCSIFGNMRFLNGDAKDGETVQGRNSKLDLSFSSLTTLPSNLTVKGTLDLTGSKISQLPAGLSVSGGMLRIAGTGVTALPTDLRIEEMEWSEPLPVTEVKKQFYRMRLSEMKQWFWKSDKLYHSEKDANGEEIMIMVPRIDTGKPEKVAKPVLDVNKENTSPWRWPWPGGTTPLSEEEKQVAWIAFQPELINYFLTDQKMNDSARAVLHYVKPGSLKSRSRDE